MKEIRALGYIPKFRSKHNVLAKKYHAAVRSLKLSSEQIEEAEALTAAHTNPLPEAFAPQDPLEQTVWSKTFSCQQWDAYKAINTAHKTLQEIL